MTEAERKLLIWAGVLHLRTMRLTAAEADEIDGLIGAVRLSPIPQPAPEPAEVVAPNGSADTAATFVLETLAAAVGGASYSICDGTETWEGDVGATVYAILRQARVLDDAHNVARHPVQSEVAPAKVAPVPVTEEMRKAAYLEAVAALDDGVPDNLYWDRILTAALAAAPPDPLREAVERYATQLTEQPSSVAHAIAHGLRAILETGRG